MEDEQRQTGARSSELLAGNIEKGFVRSEFGQRPTQPLRRDRRSRSRGRDPLDIDLSVGDDYLYALEGGSGKIAIFAVGAGGDLSARTAVPTGRGGSSGLQGIAAF
jgi:hypothetical protein